MLDRELPGQVICLYFASGSVITGLVYNLIMSTRNYRATGRFWTDQNLVVDGHLKVRNLLGFILFCCVYVTLLNSQFLTVYFADKS